MSRNEQIAARLGVTVEQIRAQHRRNAAELSAMAAKAKDTGKKVNKYTYEQLTQMAQDAIARSEA